MESAVTVTDEYIAFDRTAFDKVLEEHQFQQSGAVDDNQIRRMGVYAGVDLVLVTEVSSYDGYMTVLVKILNIETGESSKSVSELMEQTPPIVQSSCKELAKKVFGIVDFNSGVRKGTLHMPEGRYEGEIQNGKPHGTGKMYYNKNDEKQRASYEGEWKNGVISGQGTMIMIDGNKYVGGWFNNQKSGFGTIYAPGDNGATKLEGKYVNDKVVGDVTVYFGRGDKYVGPMPKKGNKVIGTHYYPDGKKYIGKFDSRFAKEGEGTLYTSSGDKIVGEWHNDVLHGHVHIYYNKDNDMEEYGSFVNGKPDGEWTRCFKQGLGGFTKYQKGQYSNGVMTRQYR